MDPTAVTGDDLRIYKEALRKSGQASATIVRKLSVIRGSYEQWGKKGFVDWHTVQDTQAAESPRVEKNSTPGLTQSEANKLLQVVRERAAHPGRLLHEQAHRKARLCSSLCFLPDSLPGFRDRRRIGWPLNNGAPMHQVQGLAGHADIRTTQGYYMRKDSDAEAAARHIQIR